MSKFSKAIVLVYLICCWRFTVISSKSTSTSLRRQPRWSYFWSLEYNCTDKCKAHGKPYGRLLGTICSCFCPLSNEFDSCSAGANISCSLLCKEKGYNSGDCPYQNQCMCFCRPRQKYEPPPTNSTTTPAPVTGNATTPLPLNRDSQLYKTIRQSNSTFQPSTVTLTPVGSTVNMTEKELKIKPNLIMSQFNSANFNKIRHSSTTENISVGSNESNSILSKFDTNFSKKLDSEIQGQEFSKLESESNITTTTEFTILDNNTPVHVQEDTATTEQNSLQAITTDSSRIPVTEKGLTLSLSFASNDSISASISDSTISYWTQLFSRFIY